MHPDHGGRVVLERELVDERVVRYLVALYTPVAVWRAPVEIARADGKVTFGAWEPVAPPAWLVETAQAFARAEWSARRGPDAEPWPARINRWRAERPARG